MKRILAFLMSIVLSVGLVPLPAFARGEADLAAGAAAPVAPVLDSGSGEVSAQDEEYPARVDRSLVDAFTARSIGIGGHGAAFDPTISPHDPKTFVADCDMGGLYVTHDEGLNWDIKSCGGRIWDIQADPGTAGVFYAGGSGLWRSADYGDTWSLIWPNPAAITGEYSMLSHTRSYYYSTDSFPDRAVVEALAVDPLDSAHIAVVTSQNAASTLDGSNPIPRSIYESRDGGATFSFVAQHNPTKAYFDNTTPNARVFIEPAVTESASPGRIVIAYPDGIFEAVRSGTAAGTAAPLYEPAGAERIIDYAQTRDNTGVHYVVLETANTGNDAAAYEQHTRIRLWHTSNFADASARVDLTDEMVADLPREYNTSLERDANGERTIGTAYEITAHNAIKICAPSTERIYLAYKTRDATDPSAKTSFQGINGLVTYDASRPQGSRFAWAFGLRLWWKDFDVPVTPDQNMLMERAHCDSSYTMLGMGCDPNNPKRIVLSTHATFLYSPDIDVAKVYQASTNRNWANLYPRYARGIEANPDPDLARNPAAARMRSTGLEVTVTYDLAIDPFDENHLILGMDDAGVANSYDKGETWYWLGMNRPAKTSDTCFKAVFDEGQRDVVYALWHSFGGGTLIPSSSAFSGQGRIARSTDGGKTWDYGFSSGIPETAVIADMAIVYPRDATGAITSGPRTIYVATFGRGFYVSHDSGVTFAPMNAGIPTIATSGIDAVWARSIKVSDDGRIFGMTQYSSLGPKNENGSATYHSTQDGDSFGNVWEWDAGARGGTGAWVRLPFNAEGSVYEGGDYAGGVQVRQPRDMYYDESTRTLYVVGVGCIGPYVSQLGRYTNFGGGLYAYTSGEGDAVGTGAVAAIDPDSPLLGNERNLTGIGRDSRGRMWLATEDGEVYVNGSVQNAADARTGWTQVLDKTLRLCFNFRFDESGTVYFLTRGCGALRIEPTAAEESGGETGGQTGGESGEGTGGEQGTGEGGQQGTGTDDQQGGEQGGQQGTGTGGQQGTGTGGETGAGTGGQQGTGTGGETGAGTGDDPASQPGEQPSTHQHAWGPWVEVTSPTCTESGLEESTCASDSSHKQTRAVQPLGHVWGTPSYAWSDDSSTVTATALCEHDAAHVFERSVQTTYAVTKAAGADAPGEGTYTATFSEAPFTTQTRIVEIAPTGERPGATDEDSGGTDVKPGGGSSDKPSDTPSGTSSDTPAGESPDTPSKASGDSSDTPSGPSPATEAESGAEKRKSPKVVHPVFELSRASGDRLYLASADKAARLARQGWQYHGTAFFAPKSGTPVYRMVSKKTKMHRYVLGKARSTKLARSGWKRQGIAFRALPSKGTRVYSLHNAKTHSFALSRSKTLPSSWKKAGWKRTGVAFRV